MSRATGLRGGVAAALATLLAVLGFASAADSKPLQIGFADTLFSSGDAGTRATWFGKAKRARADIVRIDISWRQVAPGIEPLDPTNPAAYNWGPVPAAVAQAKARGLDVMLAVSGAPSWAEGPNRAGYAPPGTWRPDAEKFGEFARALARQFQGQVRRYQAWVEPNIYTFLNPQYEGKRLVGPDIYRRMLNRFYAGVNAVQPKAMVISGGTAPYGDPRGGRRTRPLAFLRDLLCLKDRRKLKPTKCPNKARLDALAHHPINTSGGPRRSALHPDDVATPDLKHVVRTLRKAERTKRVKPGGRRQVWVTEFWWETKPPDKCTGVPLKRQARWIRQALKSFKRQGASVAINFQIRDTPYRDSDCGRATFQSGAFFANGNRKPSFRAFRKFGR